MSGGWIKLHRKTIDSEIFQDAYIFRTWTFLLMSASHKPRKALVKGEVISLDAGQTTTSARLLASQLGIDPHTANNHLSILEELGSIKRDIRSKCSVITIINWEEYQSFSVLPNHTDNNTLTNTDDNTLTNTKTRSKRMYKKDKKQTEVIDTLNSLSDPYEGLNRTQTEDAEHYAYRLEKLGGCDSRLPEIVAEWVIRYDSSDISEAVTSAERGRARNPVAYVRKILSEKESKADRERREREACTKGGGTWL